MARERARRAEGNSMKTVLCIVGGAVGGTALTIVLIRFVKPIRAAAKIP